MPERELTPTVRLAILPLLLAAFASAMADDGGLSADSDHPTLYLIGDSTVKCGRGDGGGGMYGWGQQIGKYFDQNRIRVENRALGGRSSRTYLTEGLWDKVAAELRPGDFVLIQFGHNDGGQVFEGDRPRASIKGNGDETVEGIVEQTGKQEVVRSYGWYLRNYINQARAKGATPIVLSLVPRDLWRDDKVIRASADYGKWAAEAARVAGADFIDLNQIVAARYETDGFTRVHAEYFTPLDHTHTSCVGAEVNAQCVVEGIRELQQCQLKDYLQSGPLPPADHVATNDALRFDFGPGEAARGYRVVRSTDRFSSERGYGFEDTGELRGEAIGDDPLADFCASDEPFYFSVAVPEGNYLVDVVTPGAAEPITIKAELRRLMVERERGH